MVLIPRKVSARCDCSVVPHRAARRTGFLYARIFYRLAAASTTARGTGYVSSWTSRMQAFPTALRGSIEVNHVLMVACRTGSTNNRVPPEISTRQMNSEALAYFNPTLVRQFTLLKRRYATEVNTHPTHAMHDTQVRSSQSMVTIKPRWSDRRGGVPPCFPTQSIDLMRVAKSGLA